MTELISQQIPEKESYSRVEWVYRTIKKSILTNEYYPGYQALEPEIAKNLGVSRTPVREALIRLENERLVELIPRRGMRVVPLVPEDMRDIYQVLTALETTAAELLAKKNLDKEALKPLEDALDDMDASLDVDDRNAWAEADDRFHRMLLELCGNKRLAEMAATVRDQGHRARLITLKLRDRPTASNQDHRDVYDAILKGDWLTASKIHHAHRNRASDNLVKILSEYKLPQL